jgi:hypothetical protein
MNFKIIISHYYSRDVRVLTSLLKSLENFKRNILVVVNSDEISNQHKIDIDFPLIFNKNIGMNIGAWDRGFKEFPQEDLYLFLQDECYLKDENFFEIILARFNQNDRLGMLGETINSRWDFRWDQLVNSQYNSFDGDHMLADMPFRRVDTYLHFLSHWNIDPGPTAKHLRSLTWSLPGDVMRKLGGFPIGTNKGECIAAEIAISRQVESLGYEFDQISQMPFSCFGHSEWRPDGFSKLT